MAKRRKCKDKLPHDPHSWEHFQAFAWKASTKSRPWCPGVTATVKEDQ
jgi:hypothetical protein